MTIAAITNRLLCREPFLERVHKIADAAPDIIVLREPDLNDADYAALAGECREIARRRKVLFAAHSHAAVAAKIEADYLWLPLKEFNECDDFDAADSAKIIVSAHSSEEASEAARRGAAAVVAGHIFATDCKPGFAPRGLEFLRGIVRTLPPQFPTLAIGGITPQNVRAVAEAGAAGVCAMSSAMTCAEPAALFNQLRIESK